MSTQLCTILASFVEGIDLGLFPASFKALENELLLSPSQLGLLSSIGGLASCLTVVIWGCLVDSYNRKVLFVLATAVMGVAIAITSSVGSFWTLALCRVVTGCYSSALLPLSQSLVADSVEKEGFGAAFGVLAVAAHLSGACAAELVGRLDSWRTAYLLMGCATCLMSLFLYMFMPDTDASRRLQNYWKISRTEWLSKEWGKICEVFRRQTFLALLAGGIVGCIPWNALTFSMMFYQGMGFTPLQVGDMVMLQSAGKAVGSYLGGWLGDAFAANMPQHGRAFLAQITILLGMVVLVIPLCVLPWSPDYFKSYAASLFVFGLVSTWCNPGVDRPLYAELVKPESRGTIVAWWTLIAGSCGNVLGAPAVGWLAEVLSGHAPGGKGTDTAALSKALLGCTMLPWTLCFLAYSTIHHTYPGEMLDHTETKRLTDTLSKGNADLI